jgi:cytochrome P450
MIANTIERKVTVPGPRVSPIFGHITQVLNFVGDSIKLSSQLFNKYGSVVALAEGGRTNVYSPYPNCPGTVLVKGAEVVREVTSQHDIYHKCPLSGHIYRKRNNSERTHPFRHFLVGLFGVNGREHRQHRQLLMPAFHRQRIEAYRDEMMEITQSELEILQVGEVVDILEFMRRLTMRIATKTLFGTMRWEQIQPSIYEYNPFSSGSRVCIGAGFAMMEIKIILAMLLMRYRLELLPQKIEAKGLIVLCAENGISMRVCKQDREFNRGVGGISGNVREMVDLVKS